MATITRIKPGQVLYDVRKSTGRASFNSKYDWWPVYVKEVYAEEGYIVASWNGNPARKMFLRDITKLRINRPKSK